MKCVYGACRAALLQQWRVSALCNTCLVNVVRGGIQVWFMVCVICSTSTANKPRKLDTGVFVNIAWKPKSGTLYNKIAHKFKISRGQGDLQKGENGRVKEELARNPTFRAVPQKTGRPPPFPATRQSTLVYNFFSNGARRSHTTDPERRFCQKNGIQSERTNNKFQCSMF